MWEPKCPGCLFNGDCSRQRKDRVCINVPKHKPRMIQVNHHTGGLADQDLIRQTGWGDHGENHGHG